MPGGNETLLRQWLMLRLIPRYPRKVTAGDITDRLRTEGHSVAKRTVERDLQGLSETFPLVSDEREKPFGWSWSKDAPVFDMPGLSNTEALAFAMLERHLRPLLPTATLDSLSPYFQLAARKLSSASGDASPSAWMRKIRVVPPAQALIPPKFDSQAQRAVTDALLLDRQVDVLHQKRGEPKPWHYVLNPLALVQRGQVTYLVATAFGYEDALLFPLHRIVKAKMLDAGAQRPKGFDIDAYIASGALGFGVEKAITLDVIFVNDSAAHLYETPISADQRLIAIDEIRTRLVATVPYNSQLVWWLLGFGAEIEVVRPAKLRALLLQTAQAMVDNYSL